jgi:hypothetical protein
MREVRSRPRTGSIWVTPGGIYVRQDNGVRIVEPDPEAWLN